MHFHSVTGGRAVTRSQAVLWTVTCTGCNVKSYQSPVLTAVTLGLRCEVRPSRSGPQIPYLTHSLFQTLTQILGLTKEQPRAEIVEKRSHRVRFRFPLPLRSRLPLLIKRSSELHLVRKYTHSVSYYPPFPTFSQRILTWFSSNCLQSCSFATHWSSSFAMTLSSMTSCY